MPVTEVNVSNLFSELKKFENSGEFDRALKVVNKSKFIFIEFCLFLNSVFFVVN